MRTNFTVRSSFVFASISLVLANLLWAGQGVAVKILGDELEPLAIALLPLYLATLLLLPLILWRYRCSYKRLTTVWRHRSRLFIAGVGGQLAAQVGMTWGVSWSLASIGAILNSLIPILSAVIACWVLREKLTLHRVAALLLGFVGVVFLSPLRWPLHLSAVHAVAGNLLILAGCTGSAFYNVYSKRLLQDFSEIEILFFSYLAATISSIPILYLLEPHCFMRFFLFTAKDWWAFGFLALFMYGLSMLLFLGALRHIDIVLASASLYLVPVFGVIFAAFLLGEHLSSRNNFGFVVVLISMLAVLPKKMAV